MPARVNGGVAPLQFLMGLAQTRRFLRVRVAMQANKQAMLLHGRIMAHIDRRRDVLWASAVLLLGLGCDSWLTKPSLYNSVTVIVASQQRNAGSRRARLVYRSAANGIRGHRRRRAFRFQNVPRQLRRDRHAARGI